MLPDGPLKQHLVLNSARLTTWETLKAEINNVRRAQAAANSTPQPMDLSAYGTQELDSFQKGKSRGKGKGKDNGKPKDDLPKTPCPICGKAGHWKKDCWYNIRNGWDEANKDGKDKTSTNTQQQSNKDKKSVKCRNCTAQGHVAKDCPKKKDSLSAVESQEQPGGTTLSGFCLNAFQEEAELNSFESKIQGVLVTSIDSGAARSVVLTGEIPGYLVERDNETGHVCTSATTERAVDSKLRSLNMRVAQVKKTLTSVYDMCATGHSVVFDFDSNKRDLSRAENKLTGERTYFKLRSRVWELEVKIILKAETEDKDARAERRGVVSFRGAATLAVDPIEDPAGSGPVRDDSEREGRGVMAEATGSEMPADHDPACEPGAIRARAVPVGPTREEKEDHNAAGHLPCRSWCRACVAGQGRSARGRGPRK